LDLGGHVCIPLAVHCHRQLAENMKDDGDVVGSEVPGNVDVFLKKTEIETPAIDVTDVADVARLDDFNDLPHGRRIEKGVIHHQDKSVLLGNLDQLLTFSR